MNEMNEDPIEEAMESPADEEREASMEQQEQEQEIEELSDPEIIQYIMDDLDTGFTFVNDTLTEERSSTLEYYYLDRPQRLNRGGSSYISPDVYSSIEYARAILSETFSGSKMPFRLCPSGPQAPRVLVDAATKYLNHTVFVHNDGEQILDDVIFDALTARIGVAKVYWEECEELVTETKEEVPLQALRALPVDQYAEISIEEDPNLPGFGNVTLKRKVPTGKVCIEVIRPEDLLVNPNNRSLKDTDVIGERLTKRLSVWLAEGYPEDVIRQGAEMDPYLDYTQSIRNNAGTDYYSGDSDFDPEISLIQAYARIAVVKGAKPEMWRFLIANETILEREVVADHPYCIYSPLHVAHIFHGASFSKTIIPSSNAKTMLVRSVIDHAGRTNNPRWQVLRGTLSSVKELIAPELGGIVNVNKPNGIIPLPQAPMNPHTFSTIRVVEEGLEQATSISRVVQGLEKDVIAKQNSGDTIKEADERSRKRLRMMARRFTYQFLIPLARKVYACAQAYDQKGRAFVVMGKPAKITPSQWPAQMEVDVELDLAPEDRERRARQITETLMALHQDPQIWAAVPWEQKRQAIVDYLKLRGFPDAEMMVDPKPPGPTPEAKMKQMELQHQQQMDKANMELEWAKHKLAEQRAMMDYKAKQGNIDARAQEVTGKMQQAQADASLRQRAQAHKEATDVFEKILTLDAYERDPETVKPNVSVDND